MIYNKNKNVPYTESLKKGNNPLKVPLVHLSLLPFLILGGWGVGGWLGAY